MTDDSLSFSSVLSWQREAESRSVIGRPRRATVDNDLGWVEIIVDGLKGVAVTRMETFVRIMRTFVGIDLFERRLLLCSGHLEEGLKFGRREKTELGYSRAGKSWSSRMDDDTRPFVSFKVQLGFFGSTFLTVCGWSDLGLKGGYFKLALVVL